MDEYKNWTIVFSSRKNISEYQEEICRALDQHEKELFRKAYTRGYIDGLKNAPTEKTKELSLPYPWCREPDKCNGKSHCPRDPNCGD